jgi:hypothetical protein
MDQNHLLEPLVYFGIADEGQKGRKSGACGEQIEIAAGVRLSRRSVPVALAPTKTGSPGSRFLRREVSLPPGTLIEKNSSSSS